MTINMKNKILIKLKEWLCLPSNLNKISSNVNEGYFKLNLDNIDYNKLSPYISNGTIVTLTTYGTHIHDVHYVIKSIINQTMRPEFIVLWLDEGEFKYEKLPLSLLLLEEYGLRIKFCKNIKSYKKIIPSLLEYSQYNLITIDDDYLYPNDMIEILIKESKIYPNTIIAHRAHYITFSKSNICNYDSWDYETNVCSSSHYIFPTTGGGVFFPHNVYKNEVLREDVFLDICPTADDVWLKFMAIYSNVKCKKVDDTRLWSKRFIELSVSQDTALSKVNVGSGNNDRQIKNIMNRYNISNDDFERLL